MDSTYSIFCEQGEYQIMMCKIYLSFNQLTSMNTPPPARLAWRQTPSFWPFGLEENFRDRMSQMHCTVVNTHVSVLGVLGWKKEKDICDWAHIHVSVAQLVEHQYRKLEICGPNLGFNRVSTGTWNTGIILVFYLHTGCTKIILKFVIKYCKNWMK